jgi:hypothetical protein
MSEFFFVVGDKDEGPAEIYASVVAVDAAAATKGLRSEIEGLVGDGAGIEIPVENGIVTRLFVGINTQRIGEDDIVMQDHDTDLQWNGEEFTTPQSAYAPDYTEALEAKELEDVPAADKFALLVRQRQIHWQPKQTAGLRFGIARQGGVSVYGLNRFPVTLYYEQWIKLFEVVDDLRRFIENNKAGLKRKNA